MLQFLVPDKQPCPLCRKVGFVRYETVLKGGTAHKSCYCGSCNHQWQISVDERPEGGRSDKPDRPDRSRSR